MAVPEDERNFSGVHRDLIEDVSVVAVQRLPGGVSAGGVERALPDRVEGAGSVDDRTADSEAALLLNHQRLWLALFGFLRAC